MPPKFRKFLDSINDQLYLYEGTVIIFDEPDLLKARYTLAEIKAFLEKLEREHIINEPKLRYGWKIITIPAKESQRRKYLGWFDWSFLSDSMVKRQRVFELVSREAFAKFYIPTNSIEPSKPYRPEDTLRFEKENGILVIRGYSVKMNLKTEKTYAHELLAKLFATPATMRDGLFFDEIMLDPLDDLKDENTWKKYNHACEDIEKKISAQTNGKFSDLLIHNTGKNGRVKLNPAYLPR